MPVREQHRAVALAVAIFLLAGCLFAVTYYHDNKYLAPPPYGSNGIITLDDTDLERPVPLVDGWMLCVDGGAQTETFIGQYSNFSFAPGGTSAFGSAVYELTVRYVGAQDERALELLIPEVYGKYTLYVDDVAVATRGDEVAVGIVAGHATKLRFEVSNDAFYYSGLYYPPVLGTAQSVDTIVFANALTTCVVVFAPLAAALFALAIRRKRDGDVLVRDFGVLCIAFAVACAHGLAWHLGITGVWWYATEDAAWSCVLVAAVSLAARAAGLSWTHSKRPVARRAACALWALPVVTFAWVLLIPVMAALIESYSLFQIAVRIGCWALFIGCTAFGLRNRSAEARFVLYGCAVLGAAFVANLLDNNAYEPVYGLWQNEYAGLFLVGVFAWMLVERVRRLRFASERARDLEVQVHAAQTSLHHMRSGEEATRAARHDLRHHVGTLRQLADQGQWERCREYLDELGELQEAVSPLRYADNMVANAVMAAYLAPAQAAGVQVKWDVKTLSDINMKSTEFAVLLSNLLSNAVEACERACDAGVEVPQLAFSMHEHDGRLAMRCENTVAPGVVFGATSKSDARNHGIGMSTMRQIAERYHGALYADIEDNTAVVRIIVFLDG